MRSATKEGSVRLVEAAVVTLDDEAEFPKGVHSVLPMNQEDSRKRGLSVRVAIWCRTGKAQSITSIVGICWIGNLDRTDEKFCDPRLRLRGVGKLPFGH